MASYRDYETAQTRSPSSNNAVSPFADPGPNEYRDSPSPPPSNNRMQKGDQQQQTQQQQQQTQQQQQQSLSSQYRSSPLNPRRGPSALSNSTSLQPLNNKTISRNTSQSEGSSDGSQETADYAGQFGVGGLGPYPNFSASSRTPSTQALLRPPKNGSPFSPPNSHRFSTISSSSSVLGFSTDSKYALPFLFSNSQSHPRMGIPFFDQATQRLYERFDGQPDDDDFIHDPAGRNMKTGSDWSLRGVSNVFVLVFVVVALVVLFAGYPMIYHFTHKEAAWLGFSFNGTGQVPLLPNMPQLVDPATPQNARTRTGFDGQPYELVFSDEFDTPGRSFYPGDDPFWEAVDLWYKSTQDLEWYTPTQVTTRDGALVIVLDEDTADEYPGLPYLSGMLQSWNKFCFTTGYIEVSVIFPGQEASSGYWPGAWIMGNLGRPGYGATGDGLWPYTYDSCDWGTLKNQTFNGQPTAAATAGGNPKYNDNISWLPGQRLSACTCAGEDHPGPKRGNGFAGRGAPEIDIFETQINKDTFTSGRVTQSVQMAPFSTMYYFPNDSSTVPIYHPEVTKLNPYRGSALQQAVSALTNLNSTSYADGGAEWTTFGFEWWANPDNRDEGFIEWVAGTPSYKVTANAFQGDANLNISNRIIPEEPMSIVLNLAVAESFEPVRPYTMEFPSEFRIDYVRVYQRKGLSDDYRSCDPPSHPTADYINRHLDIYNNAQLTTWAEANGTQPKNMLIDQCP